jgi:hypothetical protein
MGISYVMSYVGWNLPGRTMPIDVDVILRVSIPLACAWCLLFGISVWRFRSKSLWMLVGSPFVLYWPAWIAICGIPSCYRSGNCV